MDKIVVFLLPSTTTLLQLQVFPIPELKFFCLGFLVENFMTGSRLSSYYFFDFRLIPCILKIMKCRTLFLFFMICKSILCSIKILYLTNCLHLFKAALP